MTSSNVTSSKAPATARSAQWTPVDPPARVEASEGLPLLWELAATPDNLVFHSPDAELGNMAYLHTSYRWPAVYGHAGSIRITVPKAGTYYVGVVIYEGQTPIRLYGMPKVDIPPGTPSYELRVDGRVLGRFSPRENDHRERLYFVDVPVAFKGGEHLTVHTGAVGVHIVEDILLMRMRPPVRPREFAIRNLGARYVREPERDAVSITWTTTWPARCTLEYGRVDGTASERVVEQQDLANHRAVLRDLVPGEQYRCCVAATTPDGGQIISDELFYTFDKPASIIGSVHSDRVRLRIDNDHPHDAINVPITCGVPFAKSALGSAEHCRLTDASAQAIPCQFDVTARWDDGSVRGLLLTFLTDVPAQSSAERFLTYGADVRAVDVPDRVTWTRDGQRLSVYTGDMHVNFDANAACFPVRITMNGRVLPLGPMEARVTDAEGGTWRSSGAAQLVVEEAGPLRLIVRMVGHHRDAEADFFACETRFTFLAGVNGYDVDYTWGNDREPLFSRFRGIALRLPILEPGARWKLGLDADRDVSGNHGVRLRQLKDDSFEVDGFDTGSLSGCRAQGILGIHLNACDVLVAVKNFWQLYPRSIAVAEGAVELGVSADFPDGFYDEAPQKDLIDQYFYLRGDAWNVRRGVRKSHRVQMRFCEAGNSDSQRDLLVRPLTAVCDPEHLCRTSVFGRVAPARLDEPDAYDAHCDRIYERYSRRREDEHWYGQMNFGDMLGDQLVSWLNNEYDIAHLFLVQYARSGDARWLRLGEAAVRHDIDIDVCHYGSEAGAQWIHALGHTGGYFHRDPYGITRDIDDYGSGNLRQSLCGSDHAWIGGMHDWYVLTGDRTALETLTRVADAFCSGAWLNNYDWYAAREAGWHLVLLLTAHQATRDAYYLNGARIIVERVLARQTPGPRGWHHQMTPAHCYCTPRHRGEASYMIGVLATGLELFYDATGDDRVADAIVGGADQVIDEMWVEEAQAFRATSCTNTTWAKPEQMAEMAPLYMSNVAHMLFFAHRRTGGPKYRDVARSALRRTLTAKAISVPHMYWMPLALAASPTPIAKSFSTSPTHESAP